MASSEWIQSGKVFLLGRIFLDSMSMHGNTFPIQAAKQKHEDKISSKGLQNQGQSELQNKVPHWKLLEKAWWWSSAQLKWIRVKIEDDGIWGLDERGAGDFYYKVEVLDEEDDTSTGEHIDNANEGAQAMLQDLNSRSPEAESYKPATLSGYPRLAALLDCDENFMVYRRFGYLQARLLLYKQDVLRQLEGNLDRMDEVDEARNPKALRSRQDGDFLIPDRKEFFAEVEAKFKEYGIIIATYYTQLRDPICNVESYIYKKEDIVTLKPGRENAWIDAFIERTLHKLASPLIRDLLEKVDPKETMIQLYSRDRINKVVSFIIMTTILALLIIPVYVLLHVGQGARTPSMTLIMIMVLLLSTLIFSVVLTKFTSAKRHETLGAAATYCAVLVVFLGNIGNSSSGSSSGGSNGTST
ncbi:hypothetical protein BDZ45DRAFT_789262 [Acephala macrosclerotiorum]|nr:hypothetical protein BDZ45DRAFT_789262 [Acephala macrosclerotiorum]